MVALSGVTRAALCCLSIGFLVAGTISVALARGHKHEDKVEEYQQAVQHWKTTARGTFEALTQVSLSVVQGDTRDIEARGTLLLERKTGPDPLRSNEDAYELPDYEAQWFAGGVAQEGAAAAGAPPASSAAEGFLPQASFSTLVNVSSMQRDGQSVHFRLSLDGSPIDVGPVPLVRAVGHYEPEGVYDRCAAKEGIHTLRGVCWVYARLSHLCVQVEREGSGWRLAPRVANRSTSYGCIYRGEHTKWEAAGYSTVPIIRFGENRQVLAPNESAEVEDFSVEVRSFHDPYFKALELTAGSMSFGMTSLEEDVLGIVLIVMGGVFALANATAACANRSRDDEAEAGDFAARARIRENIRKARAKGQQARRRQRGQEDPETIGMRYSTEDPTMVDEHHPEEGAAAEEGVARA